MIGEEGVVIISRNVIPVMCQYVVSHAPKTVTPYLSLNTHLCDVLDGKYGSRQV